MKAAGAAKAAYVCLLGSSEVVKGVVALKEMSTGTQAEIERDRIVAELVLKAGAARC
jgi:histidyl-tRNA synthetase